MCANTYTEIVQEYLVHGTFAPPAHATYLCRSKRSNSKQDPIVACEVGTQKYDENSKFRRVQQRCIRPTIITRLLRQTRPVKLRSNKKKKLFTVYPDRSRDRVIGYGYGRLNWHVRFG